MPCPYRKSIIVCGISIDLISFSFSRDVGGHGSAVSLQQIDRWLWHLDRQVNLENVVYNIDGTYCFRSSVFSSVPLAS
ncbi:MAG: hypothetical protein HC849_02370 [Oscillatoriales cyanobacterium RU_3_3]|nr:hypothetical protein [Microcoleus sp. SU_5_3]NJM59300.1 hypothetical protein [Oscillatoriales cyanobacterium RU_3_3]NJR25426.1 hypothetical protein [Richelia sp. CSU_2_1]